MKFKKTFATLAACALCLTTVAAVTPADTLFTPPVSDGSSNVIITPDVPTVSPTSDAPPPRIDA